MGGFRMVIYKNGDALRTDCDVLCHQVNLQGVMGAGIAAQIADKFPTVEKDYIEFLPKELGQVCFSKADGYVVANCFSQNKAFETEYESIRECFKRVLDYMDKNSLESVAFPYHYGCGIARGDWDKVERIIKEIFIDKTVNIYQR